jgi:hypothetical protein
MTRTASQKSRKLKVSEIFVDEAVSRFSCMVKHIVAYLAHFHSWLMDLPVVCTKHCSLGDDSVAVGVSSDYGKREPTRSEQKSDRCSLAISLQCTQIACTAMANLLSLPAEVLFETLDYLQPDWQLSPGWEATLERNYLGSSQILAALARTCKTLRPIATVSLYNHHSWAYNNPDPAVLHRLKVEPTLQDAIKRIEILPRGSIYCRKYQARSKRDIAADIRRLPALSVDQ